MSNVCVLAGSSSPYCADCVLSQACMKLLCSAFPALPRKMPMGMHSGKVPIGVPRIDLGLPVVIFFVFADLRI